MVVSSDRPWGENGKADEVDRWIPDHTARWCYGRDFEVGDNIVSFAVHTISDVMGWGPTSSSCVPVPVAVAVPPNRSTTWIWARATRGVR